MSTKPKKLFRLIGWPQVDDFVEDDEQPTAKSKKHDPDAWAEITLSDPPSLRDEPAAKSNKHNPDAWAEITLSAPPSRRDEPAPKPAPAIQNKSPITKSAASNSPPATPLAISPWEHSTAGQRSDAIRKQEFAELRQRLSEQRKKTGAFNHLAPLHRPSPLVSGNSERLSPPSLRNKAAGAEPLFAPMVNKQAGDMRASLDRINAIEAQMIAGSHPAGATSAMNKFSAAPVRARNEAALPNPKAFQVAPELPPVIRKEVLPEPPLAPAAAPTPPAIPVPSFGAPRVRFKEAPPAPAPVVAPPPEPAAPTVDPVLALQEASVCFSQGEDGRTQAILIECLQASQALPRMAQRALKPALVQTHLALLDLYRAVGDETAFEAESLCFAERWALSAPIFSSLPEQAAQTLAPQLTEIADAQINWVCPAMLGRNDVQTLNACLAEAYPPYWVDWSRLKLIDPSAAQALTQTFVNWAERGIYLQMSGVSALDKVLKNTAPVGLRSVSADWWLLNLALLRVRGLEQVFERTALAYCVTYEISPPAWEAPLCRCSLVNARGEELVTNESGEVNTVSPNTQVSRSREEDLGMALVGQLDAEGMSAQLQRLNGLIESDAQAMRLQIDCERLVRVDQGAAQLITGWAEQGKAAGCSLEFSGLHLLNLVFLEQVGLARHAMLTQRAA
jgi:ABC-type transporter Mla MlaB component